MNVQPKATTGKRIHPSFPYGANECTYVKFGWILMRAVVDVDGMRPRGRNDFLIVKSPVNVRTATDSGENMAKKPLSALLW
jgi:hypothetical protein